MEPLPSNWPRCVAGGGVGSQSLSMCPSWYSRVYALVRTFRNKLFTLLVPSHWKKYFWSVRAGQFPLLTSAASAP